MRNFTRTLRLALRYRFTILGVFLSSSLVALLWGANVGAVYPFIEVVFRGESLPRWVDNKLAESDKSLAQIRGAINELEKRKKNAGVEAEREETERLLVRERSRLAAELSARRWTAWLQPHIHRRLPDDPFKTLALVVGFVLVGTVAKDTFLVANIVLVGRLSELTTLDLRREFYRHTLQMELSAFGQGRTGVLMSQFTNDVGAVAGGVATLFGKSLREPLKMSACVMGAALVSWRLLVLSLIITPIALLAMYLLAKSMKRANRRALEELSRFFHRLAESFSGIHVVVAFTMERLERNRFHQRAKELYRKSMRLIWYGALARMNNELLGVGVICLAILAGGYLVLSQQTHLLGVKMTDRPLSFGAIMVFYAFLAGVSDPVRKLADVYSSLQAAAAAGDRVYPMLDRQPTIADPLHPRPVPPGTPDVLFDKVNFHYEPGRPVLRDISLRLRHGETLAIVGPNGCGKTTLANLIPRFYDPVSGAIRLGGVDLRELKLRDLRRRIGMVTQQTVLFDDTIRDNIRYGALHASDEEVVEAAKKAHLHRFIESLENGYDTNVGERGGRLSGGQRQRIALARAILRNPAILILDEATSEIDPESERMIHIALESFIRDRTTIVITHRMSTLALADRILVMDDGAIADMGVHDELMGRCPLYRRLRRTDFKLSA